MRLGLLVDAACDLPLAFIAQNPIRVMPIPIRIGDRELVDRVVRRPRLRTLHRAAEGEQGVGHVMSSR